MQEVIVKQGIINSINKGSNWLLPGHVYHVTGEDSMNYQFDETTDMTFPKSWFVEYTGQREAMVVTFN